MRARLKAKAKQWKERAMLATTRHKRLREQLQRSQRRNELLENELNALKAATNPLPVAGHTFPAQLIALAVFIVVHANGSLRCAAKTVGFVAKLMGWSFPTPSHSSVRRWVLRCGLYQLQHAAEKTGDYVAILDESIQIGREKLLLMLGVKIDSDRSHCRPLAGRDVVVLGLEVQTSWTGERVADFVSRTCRRFPDLRLKYAITDGGTNLAKAFRILGLDAVLDCTHVMMNAVKKILADDKIVSQLSADIGTLRRQLMLTAESYLLPPTLRDKDRFLRIFTIVEWVERMDKIWANLPQSSRDKLRFIKPARKRIQCMSQLKMLVEMTAKALKGPGLSEVARNHWLAAVKQLRRDQALTDEAEAFIKTLAAYFADHKEMILKYQRLLCCTDIIESTFGRYKNKGGTPTISADVLAIPLYSVNLTTDFVNEALINVPYSKVHEWETAHICENRYGSVRRMNRELKSDAA